MRKGRNCTHDEYAQRSGVSVEHDKSVLSIGTTYANDTLSDEERALFDSTEAVYVQLQFAISGWKGATQIWTMTVAQLSVDVTLTANLEEMRLAIKTNASELMDVRIGYDGKEYGSAGEAVRTQVEEAIGQKDTKQLQTAMTALSSNLVKYQEEINAKIEELSEATDNAVEMVTQNKQDVSMKKAVYDPNGYELDIFAYAQARADSVSEKVSSVVNEIKDAYSLNDTVAYSSLGNALRGAIAMCQNYAQALLVEYEPLTIRVVDALPTTGDERTFYLLQNASGGYDKWWWITNEDGDAVWDTFGNSTTEVVDVLPTKPDENIDYILHDDGTYSYYKYIGNEWKLISGSLSYTASELPENGNVNTDYYILNSNEKYVHYRYIDGKYVVISSDAYSIEDVDGLCGALEAAYKSADNVLVGMIDAIDAKVGALGNLVADVTESDDGVIVYFADGSSKGIATKDKTVIVEDVNKSDSGITIVYSDGDTKEIEISGGGGSVSSGSASITRVTNASTQCVYGDDCTIEYSLLAVDASGDYVGDGTAVWYVNSIKKATSGALNNSTNSFDIGPYLSVGNNTVKVSVSIDTGGDSMTTVTKSWTVNAVNMYAVWDYDDTTINEADAIAIRWTPYGDLSKTTHIVIDGDTSHEITSITTRSGVQQFVTIDKLSHGSHLVELYLTATINGTEIRSASIYHDMIFADSSDSTPVIAVSLGTHEMTQYNTLQIPVVVYTPGSLTSDAVLSVDGTKVAEWSSIDRTIHYWNYTPSEYGTKVLTITSGATTKTITIKVAELDIDVEEVTGYAYRLKASDIASNEALKAYMSNGIGITFSDNFDWNNGGIQTETDDDGNIRQYICVKAGTSMTINYQLFGDDARVNGKSFKAVFKAVSSRDYDASFLNCLNGGIGITLGANEGTITSEQNTIDFQYPPHDGW